MWHDETFSQRNKATKRKREGGEGCSAGQNLRKGGKQYWGPS